MPDKVGEGDDDDVLVLEDVFGTPPSVSPEALLALEAPQGSLVFPDSDRAVQAYLRSQISPRSQQNAADALKRLTRLLLRDDSAVPAQIRWPAINYELATTIRTVLYEATRTGAITPGTANLTLSHLRGLLRAMYGIGLITSDQLGLVASGAMKSVPGKRVARGRALSPDEEKTLRAAAQALDGYRGAMLDAAIVLAIGAGLRREEVVWLSITGAQPKGLTFIGKGNKERFVPINVDAWNVTEAWIEQRARFDPKHGKLFCSPQRPHEKLSNWSFWALVRTAAHNAFGEQGECVRTCRCNVVLTGPHDFRRTFATRMLEKFDIRQVQVLMGHESPETTARYDKRDLEALFEKARNTKVIA